MISGGKIEEKSRKKKYEGPTLRREKLRFEKKREFLVEESGGG